MEHIMSRCQASSQAEVWNELKKTWAHTGVPWADPGWGAALRAGCAILKMEEGARRAPIEPLWTILWSESLRCEWIT
ncbi:hypothetical protein BD309DRAFT_885914, partial [Dichomitus squalens]|uniref:Uncharacterized protein n=1 Tax=Dichomitus squalens TaxID=114155 RepID=A0A4Q9M626_9APHY